MKAFVDDLAEQDISANKIWTLKYKKFYENSTCVVRGLSRKQVVSRVGNSKSGNNIFSLLESPERSKVSGSDLGFFQFQYVWHDDTRAKQKKSGIERLVGWSHPELRNLLRIDGAHLFVDGTFRCTPKSFHQFVTLMMYDQYTELFVPVFFTLATNKTETLYTKMFTCIEFALGKDIKPGDVVCDFEGAMILAIRGLFPSTRIVGCLFHFKQACRRKLKEYRMPNDEASIAMSFGVFDMLTVIDPDKIAIQGVTWVKREIKKRCNVKGLAYSRRKWKMFWRYFSKTWLETYPPDLWNIYRVKRDIVNRTNNPLERFHRELNARMKPHPSLKYFVRSIEELAREYVVLRKSIISGDAEAPLRPPMRFPRRATLPDTGDTDSSSSDDDDDCAPGGGSSDADSELSDEDLGIVYDTSFDYEIEDDEEKSNAA
ncbi:Porphobilinogen deaminase [Phytophthora nicotianae]|uniref:Porphobilinogen deaminase n=1 Tax=Phytophthora nicotianae TaxID=4792 RepID=A0A0W8CMB7_PHYNI|nr:Porphobilinogen deaminase [Phytophthora nicotianae]